MDLHGILQYGVILPFNSGLVEKKIAACVNIIPESAVNILCIEITVNIYP